MIVSSFDSRANLVRTTHVMVILNLDCPHLSLTDLSFVCCEDCLGSSRRMNLLLLLLAFGPPWMKLLSAAAILMYVNHGGSVM